MFASAESSIQSKHTLKHDRNVLIPTIEIAIELMVLTSNRWSPIFIERKKLEEHRTTDDASAIRHKKLARTDAVFFPEELNFITKVRKDRHRRIKEQMIRREKPMETKGFVCMHPLP